MSSKISRRVCNTEIGDNNFYQDSPSEVTEDFDYDIDTLETTLILNLVATLIMVIDSINIIAISLNPQGLFPTKVNPSQRLTCMNF